MDASNDGTLVILICTGRFFIMSGILPTNPRTGKMADLVKALYVHFLPQQHHFAHFSDNTSHGPMFIGVIFNVFLYGIMIMQSYLYYRAYLKKDPKWLKLLVQCFWSFSDAQRSAPI